MKIVSLSNTKYVAALIFCLCLLKPAWGEPLVIVTEEFPPYNYTDGGQSRGLSSEIVQAVLDNVGLDVAFKYLPWARSYKMALKGRNTLIFSIARIPERENQFHWAGEIAPYRTSFYKLTKNKHIKISSLEDAKKYTIGVSVNDVIYTYLESNNFTHLDVASSDVLSLRKLANSRVELIAFDEASFVHRVRTENYDPRQFERVFRLDDLTGNLYMAFGINSDKQLVETFKKGLTAIKESGIYERIQRKYLILG